MVALIPLVLLFEEKVLKNENFPFSFGHLNGNRNRDEGLDPHPTPLKFAIPSVNRTSFYIDDEVRAIRAKQPVSLRLFCCEVCNFF